MKRRSWRRLIAHLRIKVALDCHEWQQYALYYIFQAADDLLNHDSFQHINREVPDRRTNI